MRHFYILGHPAEGNNGNALLLISHKWGGFNYFDLMRGIRIGRLPDNIIFEVNELPSDIANANVIVCPFGWKIVSYELAERLTTCAPGDVEMVEVHISTQSGPVLEKKFFAINSLQIVDALSKTKTIRSPLGLGDIKPVLKPCLIEANVPHDVHVFRLKGDENRLLVDDDAKIALSTIPHDGLVFIRVEQE